MDIFGLAVWDLGDNHYLIDDLAINYNAIDASVTASVMSIAASPFGGGFSPNDLTPQSGIPFLTIAPTATNGIYLVTVLNDTGPANYELWWTPVLANPAYPWAAIAVGTTGQTNFTVNINVYPTGFYRAVQDTNSIPLWQAADPSNPSGGILTLFIDSPTNGMVLQ